MAGFAISSPGCFLPSTTEDQATKSHLWFIASIAGLIFNCLGSSKGGDTGNCEVSAHVLNALHPDLNMFNETIIALQK
jgi:hypothetical protein